MTFRTIFALALALSVSLSASEATGNCPHGGSCDADTSGLALLQTPQQKIAKAHVEDHEENENGQEHEDEDEDEDEEDTEEDKDDEDFMQDVIPGPPGPSLIQ